MFCVLPFLLLRGKEGLSRVLYFIIQVIGRLLLFWGFIRKGWLKNFLISLAFSLKLSLLPGPLWFPGIMLGTNWGVIYIFSVIQKIALFFLLSRLVPVSWLVIACILSMMVRVVFLNNRLANLKEFVLWSTSIDRAVIIIVLSRKLLTGLTIWRLYFVMFFLLLGVIHCLHTNPKNKTQKIKKRSLVFIFGVCMFIFAGFPPFPGFYIKVSFLNLLLKFRELFTIMLVLLLVLQAYNYLLISLRLMRVNLNVEGLRRVVVGFLGVGLLGCMVFL